MNRIVIGIFFLLVLAANHSNIYARNATEQKETPVQSSKIQTQSKETKTKYTYKDSKEYVHPVYLSPTGKAYIKRKSKTTGKVYKQYLPELGWKINPSAYKNRPK